MDPNTYLLITTLFGVVWDVAYRILAPHKWEVIVGLEETLDKLCLGVKSR